MRVRLRSVLNQAAESEPAGARVAHNFVKHFQIERKAVAYDAVLPTPGANETCAFHRNLLPRTPMSRIHFPHLAWHELAALDRNGPPFPLDRVAAPFAHAVVCA
jgi:hypothetical protein